MYSAFAETEPYTIAIRAKNSHAVSEAIVNDAFWMMFARDVPFETAKTPYSSTHPDGKEESGTVITAKKGSSAIFKIGSAELVVTVKAIGGAGSSYSFTLATKGWNKEEGAPPDPNGAVLDVSIDEEEQYSIASIRLSGLKDEAIQDYRHLIVMLASNLKSVVETGKPLITPNR